MGLRVETPDLRLLCDPWVSPGGAFLGSWFPFPDNSHLHTVPGLLAADWVAVSSAQADHLDLPFLSGLDEAVPVVIPAYPSSVLRDQLSGAGVKNIVEVEGWQRLPLNGRGDWLTVVPEQSPMAHRAAFLVFVDGVSVLHCNDARLSLAQVRRAMIEVGGPLDLLAVDASEPWFRAVKRLVRTVKPRLVLSCGESDELPAETLRLLPGDGVHITATDHQVVRDPHWEGNTHSGADSRAQEAADLWAAYPDPAAGSGLADRFAEHFARLRSMSPYFLERIAMTVRFEVTGADGGVWDVHLGSDEPAQYTFRVEARWLDAVLRGDIRWDDLLLSQRFQTLHSPDVDNEYLFALLKHANADALQAIEDYDKREPNATVTLSSGDRTFEVTRYCPHSGEDLAEGAVIDEAPEGLVLRCLAHNFDFSLTTGLCLNARCEPIVVAAPV
ncbi:Rieske 2Fe-2S domain-containing protein [Catenulispora sp. MAP5-51]|uniref:Rieske 2Fe-2S domain-containing protein n=1 Tax=Catenulispora sp. MAP5-51 TaxID=3156298 RepID=UPI0035136EBD